MAALSLAAAQERVSLLGTWTAIGDLPDGGTNESTLEFAVKGDAIVGTVVRDDEDDRAIDLVKTDGKKVTLEIKVERDGQSGIIRVKAEETRRGRIAGTWYLIDSNGEERAKAPWVAERLSEPEPEPATASIVGKWNAVATTQDGNELPSVVTFEGTPGKYTGKSVSDRGENAFESVKVKNSTVEIEFVLKFNDNEVDVRIEAELKDPDHLKGKWVIFNDSGEAALDGPWEAKRALQLELAGTWNAVASTDDEDREHRAIFEKTDQGYRGRVEGENGSADYTTVKVSGNDVELVLPFGEGTVKVVAKYTEAHTLKGEWAYFDSSDTEQASNAWVAKREVPKAAKAEKAAPPVVGGWVVTLQIGDNERDYALNIAEDDGALSGSMVSPRSGKYDLDSVSFGEGQLVLKVTREIQGNDIEFTYKGSLSEDDTLSGTFVPKGYEDQFSGKWTAKRKP